MIAADQLAFNRMLDDQLEARRLIRAIDDYERIARFKEAQLFADVRKVITRADRAIKGDIQ